MLFLDVLPQRCITGEQTRVFAVFPATFERTSASPTLETQLVETIWRRGRELD
jgi:hypothetical protein